MNGGAATSYVIIVAVTVMAITPGPNNLIVMKAAADRGLIRSLPMIGAVVAGSLSLLVMAVAGFGAIVLGHPELRHAISFLGVLYLLWIGCSPIINQSDRKAKSDRVDGSPLNTGTAQLYAFQFMNPKAWVMVVTTVSYVERGSTVSLNLLWLALVFSIIPCICLLLWAMLGEGMRRYVNNRRIRIWFDRASAIFLIGCAVGLIAADYLGLYL